MNTSKRTLLREVVLPVQQPTRLSIAESYRLPDDVAASQLGWRSGSSFSTITWRSPGECSSLVVQDLGEVGVLSHGWRRVYSAWKIRHSETGEAIAGTHGYVRLGGTEYRCVLKGLRLYMNVWIFTAECFWLTDKDVLY